MNKKGMLFNVSLVVITLIVLTSALIVLNSKYDPFKATIGRQYELIEKYNEGEKYLFYLDEASKLALKDAAVSTADNGGFFESSECGTYHGLNLWSSQEKSIEDCAPLYKENYLKHLSGEVDEYLMMFNRHVDYNFPLDAFYFDINGLDVLGFGFKNVILGKDFQRRSEAVLGNALGIVDYSIGWVGEVDMKELWDDKKKLNAYEKFVTAGTKVIHADARYNSNGKKLIHNSWTIGDELNIGQVAVEENHYGLPKSIVPLNAMYLRVKYANGDECYINTNEFDDDVHGDLKTWDNEVDDSCEDSKTFLSCPGVKVYYCGKYGYETFPKRDIPGWTELGDEYSENVRDFYVSVEETDNDGFPVNKFHTKTAAKFVVDFDKKHVREGSVEKDGLLNRIVDKVNILDRKKIKGEEADYTQYSFKPNFRANIGYDIESDYDYIYSTLEKLGNDVKTCEEGEVLDVCVNEEVLKLSDKNWRISMPAVNDKKEVLYEFSEGLKQCIDLMQNDLICRKVIESNEDFSITLEEAGGSTVISNGEDYDLINDIVISGSVDVVTGNNEFFFIKENGEVRLATSEDDVTVFKDLYNRKYILGVTIGDIDYYMAYTFRNIEPPAAVKNLNAVSAPHLTGSVMLEWDMLTEKDVEFYEVYYSNAELLGWNIEDYDESVNVLKLKDIEEVNVIDIEKCKFVKNEDIDCYFGSDYSIKLEANKLYYDGEKMILLLTGLGNSGYNFGVAGRDTEGLIIESLEESSNVVLEDNLPPGPVDYSVIIEDGRMKFVTDVSDNMISGYGFDYGADVEHFVLYHKGPTLDVYVAEKIEKSDVSIDMGEIYTSDGEYSLAMISVDSEKNPPWNEASGVEPPMPDYALELGDVQTVTIIKNEDGSYVLE